MRTVSLFSGADGLGLGLQAGGAELIAHAEVDPHASACLAHHWPALPNLGDVTAIDWSPYRDRVDLIAGGPPCQDFSVGGQRRGLSGDRGRLLVEGWIRAIAAVRPPWLLLENVPGLLLSRDGMAALVGRLADLGYGVAWRVLGSSHFGVPQRRARLFVLAHAGPDPRTAAESAFHVLGEPEGCDWNPAPRRAPQPSPPGAPAFGALGDCVNTLMAGSASGGGYRDDDTEVGQLVYCRVSAGDDPQERWAERAIASTLTSENGMSKVGAALVFVRSHRASSVADPDRWRRDELVPTLNGHDDNHDARAVTFVCTNWGPGGRWEQATTTTTLRTVDDAGSRETLTVYPGRVRRLTAIERERCMGWPDDWTRYGAGPDGSYEIPASARHRLTGNGVVAPIAEWIMRRLLGG